MSRNCQLMRRTHLGLDWTTGIGVESAAFSVSAPCFSTHLLAKKPIKH